MASKIFRKENALWVLTKGVQLLYICSENKRRELKEVREIREIREIREVKEDSLNSLNSLNSLILTKFPKPTNIPYNKTLLL